MAILVRREIKATLVHRAIPVVLLGPPGLRVQKVTKAIREIQGHRAIPDHRESLA